MQRWVAKEKWAEQKRATYYSPDQVIQQLFEELRKIDEGINTRTGADAMATKEELDARTKIVNLINSLQKNSGTNWRNLSPEYDLGNRNLVDLNALGALERKNLEKRIAAAEEDARLGPGERFSEEKMDQYYTKVAKRSFAADTIASRTGMDGKPLPPDDPQRLKWEALMRQGIRPFRKRNEETESEEQSVNEEKNENGEQNESEEEDLVLNDADLPEGLTWEMLLNDEDLPGRNKDESEEKSGNDEEEDE